MKGKLNLLLVVLALATLLAGCCNPVDMVKSEIAVVKTENFRVSNAMMTYFFWTQIDNYYQYYCQVLAPYMKDQEELQKFAFQTMGIEDTDKSLKEQKMNQTSSSSGEITVFDFYMNLTEEYVTLMLTYCELALQNGIELTDEDRQEIDRSYETFRETYQSKNDRDTSSAYPPPEIVTEGLEELREKDVRRCLELVQLAGKYEQVLNQELALPGQDAASSEAMDTWKEKNLLALEFNREAYKYIDA